MPVKDSDSSHRERWSMGMESVEVDLQRAVIGGSISFVIILGGGWLVGYASASEAYQLFKTTLPNFRSFCGTLTLALGNILALMLTLLSLSASLDIDIKWSHYQRVKQISWTVAVTLISTIVLFLLLNIPIVEADNTSASWFSTIYYITLIISSLLGGAFITIVLLLYNTVLDMINVLNPEEKHRLRHDKEEE